MSIQITNQEAFKMFLNAISKFVPAAEFMVTENKTSVYSMNEDHTVRAFFDTSICKGDPCTFALNEIKKLNNSLSLTSDDQSSTTLNFDGKFLRYTGTGSFKLKTVKREVIEKYVSVPMKSVLTPTMSFTMTKKILKTLNSANTIVASESSKLYISMKDGIVVGEIDDKTNALSDSISIPLVESSKYVTGSIDHLMCLKLSDFLQILTFPAEAFTISFTDKNAFMVEGEVFDSDGNTQNLRSLMEMLMIISPLKI